MDKFCLKNLVMFHSVMTHMTTCAKCHIGSNALWEIHIMLSSMVYCDYFLSSFEIRRDVTHCRLCISASNNTTCVLVPRFHTTRAFNGNSPKYAIYRV